MVRLLSAVAGWRHAPTADFCCGWVSRLSKAQMYGKRLEINEGVSENTKIKNTRLAYPLVKFFQLDGDTHTANFKQLYVFTNLKALLTRKQSDLFIEISLKNKDYCK
jgi:hypothetical protein